MATATKAKPRPTSKAKAATPPRPIVPEVGADYIVRINSAPFWEPPKFGDPTRITILKVTDTTVEPMTARDLAQYATANIGRYLVLATDQERGTTIEVFWNDLRVDNRWDDDNPLESPKLEEYEKPYAKFHLRIVVRLVGSLIDTVHSYGPTIAERLQLIAKVAELREASEDEPNNDVRIRSVVSQ